MYRQQLGLVVIRPKQSIYIDIKYNWIRDWVSSGAIQLIYGHGESAGGYFDDGPGCDV